jgi:predicted  nucleic acid-binding Zn-ribbon protein
LQRRVRDLNRRLYDGSVRNPHDLLEMQRELDALRERKDQAEEVAIALMEAEESASGEEHDAAAAAADREARRTAELGPLEQHLAALRQELASATAEREHVLAEVAPADVALYTRVAARHHPALVQVIGDSCGGCHLPLSIEERRAVRTGAGIVQCSNCDRILVT